ncbi:nucleotidyltransferase domain-containing protein [Pyrococcus kukulkanii]|uniref:nucleotidyltransferase domain-containing protein n=1 Tax=Pyrococcus kukulkanii TaxID=1609559 RepID=UPI00356143A6
MIKNYHKFLPQIKEACREVFGECEVYVFGSVVEGKFTAESDVDILIVVESVPESLMERAKLKVEIEERAGLPEDHPFEFHIVDKEGFEWYKDVLKVKLKPV